MADNKQLLDNHTYDVVKNAVILTLPALATLYFAIAQIWGLPNADEVTGTITAITVFLGVVLRISSKMYGGSEIAGTIDITTKPDGGQNVLFGFKDHEIAENLDKRDTVTFKVNKI